MSENQNQTSTPRQAAFFSGISSTPKRSGIPRAAARIGTSPSPDYSTPEAITARCREGAGSAAPPPGTLGEEFQKAVKAARERMADPNWGREDA